MSFDAPSSGSTPTRIRREAPADFAAIAAVVTAAFGRPQEAQFVAALRDSDGYLPNLAFVAEHNDAIVGHILYSVLPLETDGGEVVPLLTVAPVAVRPDRQRRGIGGQLIRAGLDIARLRPEPAVIVVGHPPYYPRFGFVPAARFGLRLPFECPPEAFMALELVTGGLQGRAGVLRFPSAFNVAM